MDITTAQVERLADDGAILLPALIDSSFVTLLNRGVERNIRTPSPRFKRLAAEHEHGYSCIEDHWSWPHIPEYEQFFRTSGIAAVAGALLCADEIRLLEDQYLEKGALCKSATQWHQDQPFFAVSGQWISFWIALDDICADDALQVVRGSHRSKRLYESEPPSSPNSSPTRTAPASPDRLPGYGAEPGDWDILRWALRPGDAVAFDPFAIHGNGGNASRSRARRFIARLACEDTSFRKDWLPCAKLIPDHGLSDGEPLSGPKFPLLWRRV